MNDIIQEGNADLYNYFSQNERMYVILSYICRLRVLNENYKSVVKKFMNTLPYDSFEGMLSRCEIFIILLSKTFDTFYNTYDSLEDVSLIEFFWNLDWIEFRSLIKMAEKYEI